ncbi:MAG: hypothetical protein HY985_08180 [Magnetospirillum sp.]|nr:hypothetical protein [Magnetospirillum sp.]
MTSRFATVILAAMMLSACGGPRVEWGNERGGFVSFEPAEQAKAFKTADKYCAGYGRKARINQVKPAGNEATFDCVE